jgi:hypothetical protein
VYNKPNGCSATGALAAGPEHHYQQQQMNSNQRTDAGNKKKQETQSQPVSTDHIILKLDSHSHYHNGQLTVG